jgi:hypothetical protein
VSEVFHVPGVGGVVLIGGMQVIGGVLGMVEMRRLHRLVWLLGVRHISHVPDVLHMTEAPNKPQMASCLGVCSRAVLGVPRNLADWCPWQEPRKFWRIDSQCKFGSFGA